MTKRAKGDPTLCEQVKDYLRAEIMERLSPGERIPSEHELSRQFKVSRTTTRNALRDLYNEGIITRIQGKGTFVAERKHWGNSAAKDGAARQVIFMVQMQTVYNEFQMIAGASQYLHERGYDLTVKIANYKRDAEREVLLGAMETGKAGIIAYPYNKNDDIVERILKARFPYVEVDCYTEEVPTSRVITDNYAGAYDAVRHLVELGHRRIAFATSPLSALTSVFKRFRGYWQALFDSGIPADPELLWEEQHPGDSADRFVQRLLGMEVKPTAVFCLHDIVALGVEREMVTRGYSVPGDLAIVGYDDNPYAAHAAVVPLTTVAQDFVEMGRKAAELLLLQIEQGDFTTRIETLPSRLIVRESTTGKKGQEQVSSGMLV
ncbi:MAG: GntR family transcriptional regulator [Bacteroidota bacterium]